MGLRKTPFLSLKRIYYQTVISSDECYKIISVMLVQLQITLYSIDPTISVTIYFDLNLGFLLYSICFILHYTLISPHSLPLRSGFQLFSMWIIDPHPFTITKFHCILLYLYSLGSTLWVKTVCYHLWIDTGEQSDINLD